MATVKTEKSQEQISKEMDAAAVQAVAVLKRNLKKWSATDLCKWWAQNYTTAGHKRLGRAVAAIGKNGESE